MPRSAGGWRPASATGHRSGVPRSGAPVTPNLRGHGDSHSARGQSCRQRDGARLEEGSGGDLTRTRAGSRCGQAEPLPALQPEPTATAGARSARAVGTELWRGHFPWWGHVVPRPMVGSAPASAPLAHLPAPGRVHAGDAGAAPDSPAPASGLLCSWEKDFFLVSSVNFPLSQFVSLAPVLSLCPGGGPAPAPHTPGGR